MSRTAATHGLHFPHQDWGQRSLKEDGDHQQAVIIQTTFPSGAWPALWLDLRGTQEADSIKTSWGQQHILNCLLPQALLRLKAAARWQHKWMTAHATDSGIWQDNSSSGLGRVETQPTWNSEHTAGHQHAALQKKAPSLFSCSETVFE